MIWLWKLLRPFLPYIAIAAALIGAYFWIDHRGYQRGYADKNAEVLEAARRLQEKADRVNGLLATTQMQRDAALNSRLDTVQNEATRLQTIVIKESANDPRYRSPDCSLTRGVFDAINAARRLSDRTGPDGAPEGSLPGPDAAP